MQESSRCRGLRRPRIVRKKDQVAGHSIAQHLDHRCGGQLFSASISPQISLKECSFDLQWRAVALKSGLIGSARREIAVSAETPEKWPALPLACPPVCFWRLVALPAANCETHQRLRRVSAGHTTKTRVGRSTPSKLRGRSRDCFSEMHTELVRSTTAALRTSANARPRCDDTVCSVRATSTQLH